MRQLDSKERGATLVEAALVYTLLFFTLFAVVEFGLAFKDWLSVSHSAREGARTGATYGDDPRTNIAVLRAIDATLAPAGIAEGVRVNIFDAASGTSDSYVFTPSTPDCTDNTPVGLPPLTGCCEWSPCPEPFRDTYSQPTWTPADRDVEAPNLDRIGVEVEFTHVWLTNFILNTTDFTTSVDYQIEPQVFES